jgi:hypothetical protein
MTPHSVELPYIAFNGSTRYARQGDMVTLFADRIDNLNDEGVTSAHLCLQLWACQSPYSGGELRGWKLAELPLGVLASGHFLGPVESQVPASFPESGDFAVVLLVAEWDGEGYNRIHDFHNYPCRDVFIHPRLQGTLGYRWVDEQRLVVDVECIENPRDPDNMSGTLALELWALSEPYRAGDFRGHALGAVVPGSLAGGASWRNLSYDINIAAPPDGSYTLVLMLREWNGNSYITRDHCNFRVPVTFPLDIAATAVTHTPPADETPEPAAQPVRAAQRADDAPGPRSVETRPAQDPGTAAPEEARPVPPQQQVRDFSAQAQALWDYVKRLTQPLRGWIRRHW